MFPRVSFGLVTKEKPGETRVNPGKRNRNQPPGGGAPAPGHTAGIGVPIEGRITLDKATCVTKESSVRPQTSEPEPVCLVLSLLPQLQEIHRRRAAQRHHLCCIALLFVGHLPIHLAFGDFPELPLKDRSVTADLTTGERGEGAQGDGLSHEGATPDVLPARTRWEFHCARRAERGVVA